MLVNIHGAKCVGIDAVKVTVEVDITRGVGIHMVGLADAAVKESLLRTTTALQALGFKIPGKKIIINLAPADLHKSGSGYDIPIAVGIILASEQRVLPLAGRYIMMGELGLDGSVRDIPGALSFTDLSIREGMDGIILPLASALEAVELDSVRIYGVRTLGDVVRILSGLGAEDLLVWNTEEYLRLKDSGASRREASGTAVDFADIIGQEGAKRGLEIAASGGHNVIMVGPPGSGKSSLAKAMASILPPLTREESLVTSKVYSVSGRGAQRCGLIRERPFRSPHYSASLPAIIGGGCGDSIVPGEVSLSQNGVLFLDELAQMPRSVIEALRGPLEDRRVTVSRLKAKVEFPASFMLVAASNPCPCGYWGDDNRCNCTPAQRLNYMSRLSGPILDRIDIHLLLKRVPSERIVSSCKAEPSSTVAARVAAARAIQKLRFEGESISTNAEMSNRLVERFCPLSDECLETVSRIMKGAELSMRAYFRIIKVARTIADMEGEKEIGPRHLAEASGYRFLDKIQL